MIGLERRCFWLNISWRSAPLSCPNFEGFQQGFCEKVRLWHTDLEKSWCGRPRMPLNERVVL